MDSPTVRHRSVPSRAHGFTLVRAHVGSPGGPHTVCPHAPAWLHVVETILNGARLCTGTRRRVRGYTRWLARKATHSLPPRAVECADTRRAHRGRAWDMCMDVCTNTSMDARMDMWMDMCTDTSMDAWMDTPCAHPCSYVGIRACVPIRMRGWMRAHGFLCGWMRGWRRGWTACVHGVCVHGVCVGA